MPSASRWLPIVLSGVGSLSSGCGSDPEPEPEPSYDLEALRDPETCAECHPIHHREWLGSMHAYAGEDPVFRAMNAKAQRETGGELGDFCVSCHAPVALALGLTEDGLNLDELPQEVQGVTCYFCHQVESVSGTHNNPLQLAMDAVMRGSLSDALAPDVHGVANSDLLNRNRMASSQVCGSCHDIVTPDGAHIERTFAEWQASFYGDPDPDDPERPAVYGLTCNDCHMDRSTGPIADYPGVRGDRSRHAHSFVGVDVAVTDFPDAELGPQLRAEQLAEITEQRKTSLCASLCVKDLGGGGGAEVTVWLHNEGAGHSWPSGSGQDRRAWVELIARDDADQVLYSSGVVSEDEAIAELDDPALMLLRDRIFDADGNETHDFWKAASYESNLLLAPDELSAASDGLTWRDNSYSVDAMPARVNMRVRLRPIGLEILAELVASGDLDPAVLDATSTFDVAPAVLEWTPELAVDSTGAVDYGSCVSSSPGCGAPALN
ncbi:hypothetical protein ENSA5_24220 [Enhygromyxa salina]|uniref:Cytochrome c-552/4 domain-containing protein n=1 Tax=Enhygromyxa salina TaxID=215803 RepID=A0A2S9YBE3_9BACT|nr:multiheme c-type cytochrome [Enhygromyxa salina]PRQ02331.1 hypothetical protein ENSA5_24220 [Enhygromyxa salina]